ncbi:MAG: hypothetical protein RMA76_04175 [Deltaproteobacteria bacterium]
MSNEEKMMNATKLMTCAAAALGATACMTVHSAHAHTPSVDYRNASSAQIEAELSSHGQFIVLSDFGRVWRPYGMDPDWSPYTRGFWEYEADAWVWNSEFTWGWAAFHYGRWAYDPVYGWVWVPGSEWGPAWVAWSYDAGYVGWAPLPPSSIWVGGGWSLGFYPSSWCYARRNAFAGRRAFRRYVAGPRRRGHVARRHYPAPANATRARPADGNGARARPAGDGRARSATKAHTPVVKSRSRSPAVKRPAHNGRSRSVDLGTIRRPAPRAPIVKERNERLGRVAPKTRPDVGASTRSNAPARKTPRSSFTPSRASSAPSRSSFAPSRKRSAPSRSSFTPSRSSSRPVSAPKTRSRKLVPSRARTTPSVRRSSPKRSVSAPRRASTPSFKSSSKSYSRPASKSSSKSSSRTSKSSSRSSKSVSRGRSAKRR